MDLGKETIIIIAWLVTMLIWRGMNFHYLKYKVTASNRMWWKENNISMRTWRLVFYAGILISIVVFIYLSSYQ